MADTSRETPMDSNDTKVLITGASGFIGKCLYKILLHSGYNVMCTYHTHPIHGHAIHSIKSDLLNESLYDELTKFKPDTIIHCAGLNPSVLLSQDAKLFYQFNCDATVNLAKDFLKYSYSSEGSQPKKFLNLSTYEIYGNIKDLTGFNELSCTNPLNAYADSKSQAVIKIEQLDSKNVNFINIICTNNYGPGQSSDKLIPNVFDKLIRNHEIIISGDGSSQRTWTYIYDTCLGIMKILENGTHKRYHLSSQSHISVIGVIKTIHEILKSQNLITTSSARLKWQKADENPVFKIDSSWSEKQLNWNAKTSFIKGLEQTIDYLKT